VSTKAVTTSGRTSRPAASTLGLIRRDLGLANDLGVAIPVPAAIHATTVAANATGEGELDFSAALPMEELAGLTERGAVTPASSRAKTMTPLPPSQPDR
jgi:hypothetical protein